MGEGAWGVGAWQDRPVARYAPFEPGGVSAARLAADRLALDVRVGAADDVAGIVAVAATRGEQPADLAERVARWVADDARLVLVAVAGAASDDATCPGGVVGWGMVSRWAPDDAPHGLVVSALTVHPGWWRSGLGTRLLTDLQHWAWGRADELWSIVNARNEASLALHARLGFVDVRRAAGVGGVSFDGGAGALLCAPRPAHGSPTIPPSRSLGVTDPTESRVGEASEK